MMKSTSPVTDAYLKQELAKQGYEFLNQSLSNDGSLEVQANKLHPVAGIKNDPLYIPVAVTLKVTLDHNNHIQKIEGGNPSTEVAGDAEQFVKTLIDNNQIDGLSASKQPNTTHRIDVNEKGQQVITRQGFSMY